MLTALDLVEALDQRAPVRRLEVQQVASAVLRSEEHHPHAPVVRVREGLQVLAPHQGAPVATVLGRSDLVAQTQGIREDLEIRATRATRVIHVTRVTLGIRASRVPQARAVVRLVAAAHRDEGRGEDAPRSAIQILAHQQVELPQPSVRPAEREAAAHAQLLPVLVLGVNHVQQLVDHAQVEVPQGEMTGQWVTRATRAVGRRGLAHQQQAGEALAVILVATRVPALVAILEVTLEVVHAVVLVLIHAVVLVLIHAATTEDRAGETRLARGQQRGPLPAQGAALAPSLCLHLRPNADQPEPLMTRRRSRRFSAMC